MANRASERVPTIPSYVDNLNAEERKNYNEKLKLSIILIRTTLEAIFSGNLWKCGQISSFQTSWLTCCVQLAASRRSRSRHTKALNRTSILLLDG